MQRAARGAAALGDTGHERLDHVGVEPADADVVEEEQRLRALHRDVVDAHGDEVDADGVVAPGRGGDHGLRADTVGGRHEHGIAIATGREREQAAEPADVADDLGPEGRAHVALDALDRLLARGDVDARRPVGLAHQLSGEQLGLGRRVDPRAVDRPRHAFEHALRQLDGISRGIAGEARRAEAGARRAGGGDSRSISR